MLLGQGGKLAGRLCAYAWSTTVRLQSLPKPSAALLVLGQKERARGLASPPKGAPCRVRLPSSILVADSCKRGQSRAMMAAGQPRQVGLLTWPKASSPRVTLLGIFLHLGRRGSPYSEPQACCLQRS